MKYISLQLASFDAGDELVKLYNVYSGAISSFTGTVRQELNISEENNIAAMLIEHHPVMTNMALNALADDSISYYNLSGLIIIHRYGRLAIGDPIVFVAAASPHRKEAMEAVQYIMDRLKTDVPLWKKEIYQNGLGHWVEQKPSDVSRSHAWD